jgi:hypothetical protein
MEEDSSSTLLLLIQEPCKHLTMDRCPTMAATEVIVSKTSSTAGIYDDFYNTAVILSILRLHSFASCSFLPKWSGVVSKMERCFKVTTTFVHFLRVLHYWPRWLKCALLFSFQRHFICLNTTYINIADLPVCKCRSRDGLLSSHLFIVTCTICNRGLYFLQSQNHVHLIWRSRPT